MATRFGFRLYTVGLHYRHTHSLRDFSTVEMPATPDSDPVPFGDSLEEICTDLSGRAFIERLRYRDIGADADDTQPADSSHPYYRLEGWNHVGRRFEFKFRNGQTGSHDQANGPSTADDVILDGRAPTNEFRAHLYLPISGTQAVLGVEARGTHCPGPALMQLLGVGSKILDEERPADCQVGWWRFSIKQATDQKLLDDYLSQGAAIGLKATRSHVTPDGKRRKKDVVLTQSGLPAGTAVAIKELVMTWSREVSQDMAEGTDTTVEQVGKFFTVDVDVDEFDDAAFEWQNPDGSTMMVSPDSLRDKYTYRPWQEGYRPTDSELQDAVEARARSLSSTLHLGLGL